MKTRIFRWLLAIGIWIFGAVQFRQAFVDSEGFGALPALLFGFGSLIAGVLFVAPEIVRPTCDFFGDLLVDVIYPGRRADKPPLSYLLAHRYRDQMRIEEAVAEYQKILRYYPKEKNAHRELLLLALEAGDERIFQKYARLYQRRFHEPFDANTALPSGDPAR